MAVDMATDQAANGTPWGRKRDNASISGPSDNDDAGDNGAIAGDATTAAVAEIEEPDEGAWGAATSTTAAAVGGGTRRRK